MAFRRSTVRLRSAPFDLVSAVTQGQGPGFWGAARIGIIAFAICSLSLSASCASLQGQARDSIHASSSIERPARELSAEDKPLDIAGKVLVAVVVVGLAIAIIALPILLL